MSASEAVTATPHQAGSMPTRLLYPIREAMVLLSMSRTTIYEQIRSGRLKSVRQGSSRLVPAKALNEYIELLQNEAQGGAHDEAA
ncbi:helix-turn-helix domain-containing protein [Saccharopolyspora sp. 6V]|uniref:helix-turn-helix domain-containing protein n=1 Tax=Saccharopolyspora sp. 6V TaxID=2877239 RepID=UPI001CD61C66|nr:helix-turn-helix domain-containing protein [Saccharopolyspora sp. 6V]MCA1194157.1 helix-turn-helix domain-containing protein [Saccharopolyspora sp. 6V]